jgi:hypothetical protein
MLLEWILSVDFIEKIDYLIDKVVEEVNLSLHVDEGGVVA